jgi:hypothetical protein
VRRRDGGDRRERRVAFDRNMASAGLVGAVRSVSLVAVRQNSARPDGPVVLDCDRLALYTCLGGRPAAEGDEGGTDGNHPSHHVLRVEVPGLAR